MTAPISEREAVLRERKAAAHAMCLALWNANCGSHGYITGVFCKNCAKWAVERYPLPKITRPRVVADPHLPKWEWRNTGNIQVRSQDSFVVGHWQTPGIWTLTSARVALWADLFAHPTEEVDDDGSTEGAAC